MYVVMEMVHLNPLTSNNGEVISWRDAIIVSVVVMGATYFIQFLVGVTYQSILVDPGAFAFDSIKILGSTFFGTLLSLKGLAHLVGAKKE